YKVRLVIAKICREMNKSIQEERYIISKDNSYIAKNANIKLTTLTHPQEKMRRDAAEWIIKKLQGKQNLLNEYYYQPKLIEGETIKELKNEKEDSSTISAR